MEVITLAGIRYEVENGIYNPLVKATSFEKTGGTYTMESEVLIPNLQAMNMLQQELGVYGRARKRFLEENKAARYSAMIIEGTLQTHLSEAEHQAQRLLEMETPKMMKKLGVDETLKQQDQMTWVGMMNNIKHSIEEIIYKEIVHI